MSIIEKLALDPFAIPNSFRFHKITEEDVDRFLSQSRATADFLETVSELEVPPYEIEEQEKLLQKQMELHNNAEDAYDEASSRFSATDKYVRNTTPLLGNPYLGSATTLRTVVVVADEKARLSKARASSDRERSNSLLPMGLQLDHPDAE